MKTLIALAALACFTAAAQAQSPAAWPNRPVHVLFGFPPGGGPDFTVRIVADRVLEKTGQPVVIDYRQGATGQIATELASKATPDGYTLLCVPPAFVTTPFLYSGLPFNSDALVPITVMASQANVLLTNPSKLPNVRTVQDLIAYARANPDKLNYGSSGNGGSQHLAAELLKILGGNLRIVHVPYKGVAVMAGLLAGEVDMTFFTLGSAMPNIRGGKLRAIAVASERRNAALPEVPALAETLPGMTSATWFAMLAPPGTPPELVNRINALWVEALRHPDSLKRLAEITADPVANSPAEAAAFIAQEKDRWGKVIRQANIKAD